MINNRQGGRRRGRGGQRPQGISGRPDGNRQDNRQRGNAAQLLEKYKTMARDMQLAGDRVQTEYYLQFADHYFRVLEDSRSRFEEQNSAARATTRIATATRKPPAPTIERATTTTATSSARAAPRPQSPGSANARSVPERPERQERNDAAASVPSARSGPTARNVSDRARASLIVPDAAWPSARGGTEPRAAEAKSESRSTSFRRRSGSGKDDGEAEAPRPRRRVRARATRDGEEIAPVA